METKNLSVGQYDALMNAIEHRLQHLNERLARHASGAYVLEQSSVSEIKLERVQLRAMRGMMRVDGFKPDRDKVAPEQPREPTPHHMREMHIAPRTAQPDAVAETAREHSERCEARARANTAW